MTPEEMITAWQEYIEAKRIPCSTRIAHVDFRDLAQFDLELAEACIEDPDKALKAGEIVVDKLYHMSRSAPAKNWLFGYVGYFGNSTHNQNNQNNQNNQSNQNNQNIVIDSKYSFPEYCGNDNSLKALHLFTVVEHLTVERLADILCLSQPGVRQILSRPERATGLVLQGYVREVVKSQNSRYQTHNQTVVPGSSDKLVMSKGNYKVLEITPQGKDYLTQQATDFNNRKGTLELPQSQEHYHIRLHHVSREQLRNITAVRTSDLGKLIVLEGTCCQRSDVRPRVRDGKYQCPSCGNILSVLQLDKSLKEPTKCGCGRKGKFRMIHKNMYDVRIIQLQNSDDGHSTSNIPVILTYDLVDVPVTLGQKVQAIGVLREVPVFSSRGIQQTTYDTILECNNLFSLEDASILLTPEDCNVIRSFAREKGDNILESLSQEFSKRIKGNSKLKQALILQAVSRDDAAIRWRLRIHLYLVGLPGFGKTVMSLFASQLYSKSRYVDATMSSKVGITAVVIRDEVLKSYALRAGAMVLAGSGLAVLDELDKMDPAESQLIGEPMELGTISVSKAAVNETIGAPCRVLGCGNYKTNSNEEVLGEHSLGIKEQILDRFDLLFRSENPGAQTVAAHIVENINVDDRPSDFFRKYVKLSSEHKISYDLSKECKDRLISFYKDSVAQAKGSEVFLSPRMFQSLLRLSYASAKLRLAERVSLFDVEIAIQLMQASLQDRGLPKSPLFQEVIK